LTKRPYKSYELYMCIALNRLVEELDLNLDQKDVKDKLYQILEEQKGITKAEIRFEIKSNNFMTNKVLEKLEEQGLVEIAILKTRYNVKITKKGILHVQKFNEFYWHLFHDQIVQHYRFKKLPIWLERLE
jgi:predicted transcriptional regulator